MVGRVALCTPRGPRILPVNYSVVDDAVVFRTSAYGLLAARDWTSPLAFETDHVDYADQRGWSVHALGHGERVDDVAELEHIRTTWEPRPWASGPRPLVVRLEWHELTGRRLGTGWTRASELPVRRQL